MVLKRSAYLVDTSRFDCLRFMTWSFSKESFDFGYAHIYNDDSPLKFDPWGEFRIHLDVNIN